jgi:hypothetical protein
VFRARWAAGRKAAATAGTLPRLFYPSRAGAEAKGAGEAAGDLPRQSKATFIAKGIGMGILGALVG